MMIRKTLAWATVVAVALPFLVLAGITDGLVAWVELARERAPFRL